MLKENKMFVVYDRNKDCYIYFDSFVRDMDIIRSPEPVGSVEVASEFHEREAAEEMIEEIKPFGYDVSGYEILDIEEERKKEKEEKERKEKEKAKETWKAMTPEQQESKLKGILAHEGEEKAQEFLDYLEDKRSLPSYDKYDEKVLISATFRSINTCVENAIGRTLTEEEKDRILEYFKNGGK